MALAERTFDAAPPARVAGGRGRSGPSRSPEALAALRRVAERSSPVTLAGDRLLPVLPALAPLLPGAGLARGSTLAVDGPGATTLALALGAAATAGGSWAAVVGQPSLGYLAAEEMGVALERLLVVADPRRESWATVVAALIDAVDVVWVASPGRVAGSDARRLAARARERGAVLVQLPGSHPPEPAGVRLSVVSARWVGAERGAGHLRARQVEVVSSGRGAAARPRRARLWLPGPDGAVTAAEASSRGHDGDAGDACGAGPVAVAG